MLVYVLWAVVSVFLWGNRVNKKTGIIFLGALLIAILSLRSIDVGYTDTRNIYYTSYCQFGNYTSFVDAIKDIHFRSEPLMAMYIYILAHLTSSFQMFLSITAALSLLPIIQLARKQKLAYFTLLYFFSFYYFYYFYLLKQMLALAITVYTFECIKNGKWKKYLVLTFIASMIHKFVWPYIIAYPLCKLIKFSKKTYIAIAAVIGMGLFFSDYLLWLIINVDPTGLMVSYIHIYGTEISINFGLIINILILVLCAVMRKRVKDDKEEYNQLLVLSSINCIFNTYSLVITEFQRLAFFFGVYNAVLVPRTLEVLPLNTRRKKYLIMVVCILLIVYALFRTAVNTKCIPYDFFWNDRI